MDGGHTPPDPRLELTALEYGICSKWKALGATEGFPIDFPLDTRLENSYFCWHKLPQYRIIGV
jgi:hypothetical protein